MNHFFLQTERLWLREFSEADIPFILALDSDPRVMRYIRPPSQTLEDAMATYHKIVNTRKKDSRFGNWVAVSKQTHLPIGWFCLKDLDNTDEIEVGYRLLFDAWNKGYATEGAKALVHYGFEDCGLSRITGVTHPDNIASQKVLEKCGLVFEKNAEFYGSNLRFYAIDRE